MGKQHGIIQPASRFIPLLIILTLFVMAATLFSLIAPITQGEDELAHYRYISFIAQKGRLPINRAEREQAWYRADWPPLYHLLVGWAISPLDTTRPHLKDVGESPRRRLVGEIFYPRLIIYTADANWPWQDGILAWHIGRFMSILFAAAALIFTYLTALELGQALSPPSTAPPPLPEYSGSSPTTLATLTTALLAFTPRYLFTSAMLGDDSLFILLSASFIWLLLRVWRGNDRWWIYAIMGGLLGLSIATKYSTGLLPLVIIPVAWWRAKQVGDGWRHWLSRVAACWAGVLAGAGWWFGWIGYYFNTITRDGLFFGMLNPLLNAGPDVSMRRIFALFTGGAFTGQERPDAIAPGSFGDWWVYLFQTFWGVPVLEHDPLFPWVYLLLLAWCLLAMVGLWRLWRGSTSNNRVALAALALIVALLFPFPILRFFLTHNILETGQGRHILYPAAQAIPLLLILGWGMMWARYQLPARGCVRSRLTLYALPFFLLLWSIFLLAYMTRAYPDPLPVQTTTFNPTTIVHPLKRKFDNTLQLLGYNLTGPTQQSPASLKLTLFWKSLEAVDENYRVQLQLLAPNGQPHLTWLSHPLNGRYPTRAWDKGDVVRDEITLPLAGLSPHSYTLTVNLLPEAADTPLSPDPALLGQVDLPASPPLPTAAALGDINYHLWLNNQPVRYRQTLPLSWPPAAVQPEWTLLGPDNQPRRPVATGESNAIFIVGADWPSGDYRLQNAANNRQTGPVLTVANDVRQFTFTPPPGYSPVEAVFANAKGQPQVKLLGYTLPTRRINPGGGLPLTLYWQSLAPVLGDYVIFDVLLDENQQPRGGYDRLPREYYSTILWAEGEVVADGFAAPVASDAPPGIYHLRVGLYSLATGAPISLPLLQNGQPGDVTSVVIGPLKVGGPPPQVVTTQVAPQVTLNQSFNNQITLLGYETRLTAGSLKLTLYWRAESALPADYTTFVHLRDGSNQTITQKDSPPANGRYPTSLWDAGEIIVDEIILPLNQTPPGDYTPVIGLYDPISGNRLPINGIPANELPLERITVP